MLIRYKGKGDGYIVVGNRGHFGFQLGFVRRDGRKWEAMKDGKTVALGLRSRHQAAMLLVDLSHTERTER